MLGPPAKDKRYSYVVCQVGRALERDRLKTLVFDFWSTVVAVVSNPAPDIVRLHECFMLYRKQLKYIGP